MKRVLYCLCFLAALAACSTTRVLEEGQTRLKDNKIVVPKEYDYLSAKLKPYLKQKTNTYYIGTWNPFIYVYNWSNGKGDGWDRFVRKLGVKPEVYDSTMVEGSCKSVASRLEYLGYYGSGVSDSVVTKNRKTTVYYKVQPGHIFPIRDADVVVRDSALNTMLMRDTSNFDFGKVLSEETLEQKSESIAQYLRNRGYYGFTKNYLFFTADTTLYPGEALLHVRLEDYTRNEPEESAQRHQIYRVRNVSVVPVGGLKVRSELFGEINRIKPGDIYSEELINNTYERFSSVGLFSGVAVELKEVDSACVDCAIKLSPAKLQSVKLNFESSVNSTGLIAVTPSLQYSHKNIFGGGETFSAGFKGDFQFNPYRSDNKSNEFSVNTSISFPKFLFFSQKPFRTTLPRTEVNTSFNYNNRPEYSRKIFSASFGYNWRVRKSHTYQFYPLQLNSVKLSRLDSAFYAKITDPYLKNAYKNHFDMGMGGIFYYTTSPVQNPKETYFYTRVQLDVAGNLLNIFNSFMQTNDLGEHLIGGVPYSQYVRAEVQNVYTLRFGVNDECQLASRLLLGAGYAYGNSTSLPFERFFYAGGANSLRGWQARMVGPGSAPIDSSFTIPNQSGDMHLEANVEFRFPIAGDKFQGAFFLDAGNIWNIGMRDGRDVRSVFTLKNALKSTALDWGYGLRLDFGIILIRLDCGIKLYDPRSFAWTPFVDWLAGDNTAFHFGIGYPF